MIIRAKTLKSDKVSAFYFFYFLLLICYIGYAIIILRLIKQPKNNNNKEHIEMRNLEKDLKTCYINGGSFTTEEVIKILICGQGLDIDGYKQLFDLRYVQNLTAKEIKKLMAFTDYQYEKRRTYLLTTLVRCALDGFEPRLKPFKSLLDLRCTFLTIAKENEYKAIQWLESSELYKGTTVKDLCFKLNYLFELIEKFQSLGFVNTANNLESEKVNLFSELYEAIGVTTEEFKKIMFD